MLKVLSESFWYKLLNPDELNLVSFAKAWLPEDNIGKVDASPSSSLRSATLSSPMIGELAYD